ncbi:hypothetical protein SAY87_007107 [Trapa incisa]|uniref:Uncharacterized protein n=1 Tax=Trapa incisa TaxID=236973 RepID=A0AAN7Q541_9MYRT|nr:hypothetical protein SAY87_007107 [Trapa incisa]
MFKLKGRLNQAVISSCYLESEKVIVPRARREGLPACLPEYSRASYYAHFSQGPFIFNFAVLISPYQQIEVAMWNSHLPRRVLLPLVYTHIPNCSACNITMGNFCHLPLS